MDKNIKDPLKHTLIKLISSSAASLPKATYTSCVVTPGQLPAYFLAEVNNTHLFEVCAHLVLDPNLLYYTPSFENLLQKWFGLLTLLSVRLLFDHGQKIFQRVEMLFYKNIQDSS